MLDATTKTADEFFAAGASYAGCLEREAAAREQVVRVSDRAFYYDHEKEGCLEELYAAQDEAKVTGVRFRQAFVAVLGVLPEAIADALITLLALPVRRVLPVAIAVVRDALLAPPVCPVPVPAR